MYKEFEENPAYAKLEGPNFCKLIEKLNVYLGREVSIAEHSMDEEIIFISNSNIISRRHVNIFWDEKRSGWFVKNLSKNHIYVNNKIVKNTFEPIRLNYVSSLQIDDCKFYFFEAKDEDVKEIQITGN